jgi:hypothetical protein
MGFQCFNSYNSYRLNFKILINFIRKEHFVQKKFNLAKVEKLALNDNDRYRNPSDLLDPSPVRHCLDHRFVLNVLGLLGWRSLLSNCSSAIGSMCRCRQLRACSLDWKVVAENIVYWCIVRENIVGWQKVCEVDVLWQKNTIESTATWCGMRDTLLISFLYLECEIHCLVVTNF